MTTWDRAQVDAVLSFRARVDVAQEVERQPGAMDAVRRQVFRTLADMARTHAIELDEADIRLTRGQPERAFESIPFIGRWLPEADIELRGGHRDGDVMHFRGAPLEILQVAGAIAFADQIACPDIQLTAAALTHAAAYECVGWREEARHWVYSAT